MIVEVNPELLRWARERAGFTVGEMAHRLGFKSEERVLEWEQTGVLAYTHLQRLSQKAHVPLGYLFLPAPPEEPVPIKDFRKLQGAGTHASPDLLDTIYACQQRQSWMRDYLISIGEEPLPFVGRATIDDNPDEVAADIRATLGFSTNSRAQLPNSDLALSHMMKQAEDAGILVERNGVVGNNTHRPLDREEFRGFALADPYAPLIFINGKDYVASQMFTLVHEAVHVWLNQSGIPDVNILREPDTATERFCNAVAAEMLVPRSELSDLWNHSASASAEVNRLARHFKVSTLVLLFRSGEAELLSAEQVQTLYQAERERFAHENATSGGSGGGDYYNTAGVRLGKRFIRAVIASTLEGRTLYGEAYQLLGTRKSDVFNSLVDKFAS
jgi:Zn-dependent peptidase ImmA (M78 family)/transcriptional regulator with XRE-family HTH domain